MKAVFASRPMDYNDLRWVECDPPSPCENQVLIQVYAAGLNRADLFQRAGKYPPPPGESEILGLEVAGVIVKLGDQATKFKVGDRVMALLGSGGYAEFACAHEELTFLIPEHLSFQEAAGLPEAMMVSQMTLIDLARIEKGQRVLIHGGAGGMSSYAIPLCKALNIDVATTVRDPKKKTFVQSLGADLILDPHAQNWVQALQDHPKFGSVDAILDSFGAIYFKENLKVLERFGHLILLNSHPRDHIEFPVMKFITGCQSLHGCVLRSRPLRHKISLASGVRDTQIPLIQSRQISPCISHVFNATDLILAHQLFEKNENLGKIVIQFS